MGALEKVVAVIVTYNPPAGLWKRVAAALEQCAIVIIVDNGSESELPLGRLSKRDAARVVVIREGGNRGIAWALNRGVNEAARRGAKYVFLLDHDSTPEEGCVNALFSAVSGSGSCDTSVVAVPSIVYGHQDIDCRWLTKSPSKGSWCFSLLRSKDMMGPTKISVAIGSGMLVDTSVFEKVGGFDEKLFIDAVDTDFCLRLDNMGLNIVAVPEAVLRHQLGEVEKRMLFGLFPVFPTHHSPVRHYTISRNRVVLVGRYAATSKWWLGFEAISFMKLTLKVALFERDRMKKLGQTLSGCKDGIAMALGDRKK